MDKKLLAVMALALALPTTVLIVSWIVLELIKKELIGNTTGLLIILAVIVNIFYMMFKHLGKQKRLDSDDQ